MESIPWILLLGLEIGRFATTDDGADGLGTSLESVESGGHQLSAYEGPALQPILSVEHGRWGAVVAPAMAGRIQRLTSEDGREATLFVRQWRMEARVRYGGTCFGELDLYGSGGSATLEGEPVAEGSPYYGGGPAVGVRARLVDGLWLQGRIEYGWRVSDGLQSDGLAGTVALDWVVGGAGR